MAKYAGTHKGPFVLQCDSTGKYERYTFGLVDGEYTEMTPDISEARVYSSLRSCQNCGMWQLEGWSFVPISITRV